MHRTQRLCRPMLPPPPLTGGGGDSSYSSHTSKSLVDPLIERFDRIRPERGRRNNVQRMQWRSSHWVNGFPASDPMAGSMTIADVSPRYAVKRILLLYENYQYREAANFINRLSHGTFKVILCELPIDLFVESMPHSLSILEALYAKVFLSDGLDFSIKLLRPEGVVMEMVKFFSQTTPSGQFVSSCKKLLKVIVLSEPKMKKVLQQRRRALDKAIEGLGQHGLVGTSDETLMNLHDALKVEFERVVGAYKCALHKLEQLALSSARPVTNACNVTPVQAASHQRQLGLRQPEIQERLIKNKTLLNVVEPTLGNHSLDILLGILQRRIECDKEVLFQFTQLRKEMKELEPSVVVAPVLMKYSNGCDQVLSLMKAVSEDEEGAESSDISGYHSDSDSAIMMSGNSPYVSKRARYNFLTRSVRSSSKGSVRASVLLHPQLVAGQSSGSESPPSSLAPSTTSPVASHQKLGTSISCCGSCEPRASLQVNPSSIELTNLQETIDRLRQELTLARNRERQLQERLDQASSVGTPSVKSPSPLCNSSSSNVGTLSSSKNTPMAMVHAYAQLYHRARVDTLEALDRLGPLQGASELKSKILFSVIVLAYRSAHALLNLKKEHVRRVLHVQGNHPEDADLESHVSEYLRLTADRFDLTKSHDEVCSQIWATLYDYPCLKDCEGLTSYAQEAVRLSWRLVNQLPPYQLEFEARILRKDLHVRFHGSDHDNDQVKTYLWPALVQDGICVHKAVVLT